MHAASADGPAGRWAYLLGPRLRRSLILLQLVLLWPSSRRRARCVRLLLLLALVGDRVLPAWLASAVAVQPPFSAVQRVDNSCAGLTASVIPRRRLAIPFAGMAVGGGVTASMAVVPVRIVTGTAVSVMSTVGKTVAPEAPAATAATRGARVAGWAGAAVVLLLPTVIAVLGVAVGGRRSLLRRRGGC